MAPQDPETALDQLQPSGTETEASFSQYPEYKDSGLEWLGQVPQHWVYGRTDRYLGYRKEQISPEDLHSEVVAYYSIPNFQAYGTYAFEEPRNISSDKLRINGGELLVSKLNPRKNSVILTEPCEYTSICSTEFVPMTPERVHPRYALHFYKSEYVRQTLDARVESVTRSHQRADPDQILKIWTYFPPLNEQRAIAAFLDRETAKIDALIEKKKRLQDRLREKRATETFSLVTKGVRSVGSFRDSGVEWIGDIPEHWSRARLLHVCRLETGHTPARDREDYWQNCTIPWVTLADVHQLRSGRQEYINGTSEKISELGLAHSAARLLPENTVILSRTASVGFAGIIPEPMATSQDFVNWICGPLVEPRYLVRCLWAMKDEFRRLTMGSTHQTIYMPDVKGLTIPLPPVEEQSEIVAESEKRTGWVARLNDKLTEQISHLREYRIALISAAVTGQIDVRGRV